MRRTLRLLVAAIVSVVATPGFAVESQVPAISPGKADQGRLGTGRYCVAQAGADGAVPAVTLGGCFTVQVAGGRIDLAAEDAPFVHTVFSAISLTRGASLLQSRETEGGYRLYVAFLREGGLAILPSPGLVSASLLDDVVELELASGAAERLGAGTVPEPFAIRAGTPEAVLEFLRDVAGLWFDRALRDQTLGRSLFDDATYLVRVDGAPSGGTVGGAVAAVEQLRQAIGRAMALE